MMSSEEKMSFLKAVLTVAKVDGDVDVKEVAVFQRICDFLGYGNMEVANAQQAVLGGKETLDEYLSDIKEKKTKYMLVFSMTAIAYADGNFADPERQEIREVASKLKVSDEKLKEIEDVVAEGIALKSKVERVLERNL